MVVETEEFKHKMEKQKVHIVEVFDKTGPGYPPRIPRVVRLVKSHCTIPREYPMEPHFKQESKHMH